jgi:hypothetical protein
MLRTDVGTVALAAMFMLAAATTARAQDVVEVANGDRIRGDVRRLETGRLQFRTASAGAGHQRSAGTISIVWTEVARLTTTAPLDVELVSGEFFVGTISSPATGKFVVQTASGPSRQLDVREIVGMVPVEEGFRPRTTGSIDFGLNWNHAQNARTYTLTGEAVYRSPEHAYDNVLGFDSWLSARDDAERLTRNKVSFDLRRRLPNRWFAVMKLKGQQDEDLELDARFVAGGGAGRKLVNTIRSVLFVEGGLNYDAERYRSVGSYDHGTEAFVGGQWDWNEPGSSTQVSISGTAFISLDQARTRVDFDATVRREIFWSMYWSVNAFDDFDSNPPDDRPRSSFGVALALGWTF